MLVLCKSVKGRSGFFWLWDTNSDTSGFPLDENEDKDDDLSLFYTINENNPPQQPLPSPNTDEYVKICCIKLTEIEFILHFFFIHFSLKLECEKLANEKTEMQRHYVMVSWAGWRVNW